MFIRIVFRRTSIRCFDNNEKTSNLLFLYKFIRDFIVTINKDVKILL